MIFKYSAYNTLLSDLGRVDYVIEISEIAIRSFLKDINNAENSESFLKEKSEEHKIFVSLDSTNNYYNQVTLGHIANVYHLTETFFYELQNEYNTLSNKTWCFESKKTKLDQIITYFETKKRFNEIDQIEKYLYDTFVYYHQLRVYFSHKKTTTLSEINQKWEKAKSHYDVNLLKKYKINSPPKSSDKVDFEDYFLFTQISKDLALKISSICHPEPIGLSKFITGLKKLKNERLYNAVENEMKTKYSYIKENDTDNLIQQIIDNL